ncbi:aminotransferase class I/II-fold pyridoxal phosphate-dependent enzyme [Thalassococcus sp. BH17M4-6]|uniref:aminotransferase class I/II-fold pyridoxal phosphate-dependent enzyme n=1 Tax=Thalassococcus sp. BH17M4-6 TaxID=3413148 RepID=UPI003BDE9863
MEKDHKATLLRKLRQINETLAVAEARPKPAAAPRRVPFDFATHEKFSEISLARQAGAFLGVESPFFRNARAADGTRILIGDTWVENFAAYDYLGLNTCDAVRAAAAAAAREWGVSATASRLVGGERSLHSRLEEKLAAFLGTDAALTFVSGHATNVAVLRTLLGPRDLVLVDALAHNSIFEGIRASGAAHLTFPHNDWQWVDDQLETRRHSYDNVLIAIEGLYSMDGDAPDLAKFVEVKFRHEAWLLLDEAHSLGVLGDTGRGIAEEQGIDRSAIDVTMGTLSKTFASCGGLVAGSTALTDLLRYHAPGFVYSVGLSLPNTAAALAAVETLAREPERVGRLRELSRHFRRKATDLGLDCGLSDGFAIAPIIIGDSLKATKMSNALLEKGFNVLPVIAPAVPEKSARLRIFLTQDHGRGVIDQLLDAVAELS